MEYVGRKVEKEACSGVVEAYSPATALFKVIYDGGNSEEMELAELSRLLTGASIGVAQGNPVVSSRRHLADFDLNISAEIDLNKDGEGGGLHGLDLNEGVNYILHDEFESTPKGGMIDLNVDLNEEAPESSGAWFDLNVELKDDSQEAGKGIVEEEEEEDDDDCVILSAPPPHVGGDMELRRQFLMSSFPGLYAAGHYLPPPPPKVDLPSSSTSLDLQGASLLDFLSVYSFLRSFSVSLHVSPFEIEDLAAAIISNDSTSLLDSIHLALLTTLRGHLTSLPASAAVCLRSLNWDLLDLITWPVFLVEYLLCHSPKHIPGLDLSEFRPFQADYYMMPASAKVAILQHLCDDVVETDACRAEVTRRGSLEETHKWRARYFSVKGKTKADSSDSSLVEACQNEFVADGNGDECYLCKTDGNLICCDGCPAAFHARCVGVATALLPEGDWFCPECTIDRGKPYSLTRSIRATQSLGTDPHDRRYYACCDYLLVSDLCGEEFSFHLYRGNDIPAVVAAMVASSPRLYAKIVSAIRQHWSLGDAEAGQHLTPSEGDGGASSSRDDGGASTSGNNHGDDEYVNLYEFGRMAFTLSKKLALRSADDDATKSAEQILARHMRVVANKYASFAWCSIQSMSPAVRKEQCGWCFSCKNPECERDCLFIINDAVRAADSFTSQALGIQRRNHLIDVMCHVVWMEDRLHGLLSGPWSHPQHSSRWRQNAHIGHLKLLLLQLESNLHRGALSAEWTNKTVDSAVSMGSSSHILRRTTTRVLPKPEGRRGKRKCSNQDVVPTPEDAEGVSLSWWRGGRTSRGLFNWKNLPRSLASKASRQGGCKKIEGVCYPESSDYAKRIKCTAWRAAVRASTTTEQLALQVRILDDNIRWNAIGNVNLLPEREPRKPAKSFKDAVIRERSHEGNVIKYLIDFGSNTLIPDVVGKHGSLHEGCSSTRKKYWLVESHVPLHLLKAFGEQQLARAPNKEVAGELDGDSGAATQQPEKKEAFEYLFERAARLERCICEHCKESVLIREAVSCQYCKGFFHSSHANESTTSSSSTVEPLYTCQKCWDKKSLHSESGAITMKKRKRDLWSIVDNAMPKRRRADSSSSYWLNGLHFTRQTDDERLTQFRSKMLLLLPGEDAPNNENPKCILCGEMERVPGQSYVACENCGAWFHGDALDLSADRVQNIIGFECHSCLDKRPPLCPHQRPTGNEEDGVAP